MAKAWTEWKVLAHEPVQKLADNLWWVRGALPGMTLKRVMVVVRLSDGKLLIHNGIALDENSMAEIERFGTPAYLVVPNGAHRLDAPAYKKRYPAIKVFAPRGARAKVEEVLAVDGTYEDFPTDDVARFEPLAGVNEHEGALIVTSPDGVSVVLNDCMFNMDRKKDLLGYLFTTAFGSAPGPRVSRLVKMILIKDKQALRADFERLAELPNLTRVIVAHENIASGPAARAALLEAATYL
ncbi:MAG TPA: hypothetical protein VGM44_06950 [Polyangiaceae bacterium]|jgi:hypothetical protein